MRQSRILKCSFICKEKLDTKFDLIASAHAYCIVSWDTFRSINWARQVDLLHACALLVWKDSVAIVSRRVQVVISDDVSE